MTDEAFPTPEVHPMHSGVKFGGRVAAGSSVEIWPATDAPGEVAADTSVPWEGPAEPAAESYALPDGITSTVGRRDGSRVRYSGARPEAAEAEPVSRVIHSRTGEPEITSTVGRRASSPEEEKPASGGMDFATWEGDTNPATRGKSYADEFMRRLISGEVSDYTKKGSPRKVFERIVNERGEVTHLRIGMSAKVEGGWAKSKVQVKGLTERVATEPETGYSILAPDSKPK